MKYHEIDQLVDRVTGFTLTNSSARYGYDFERDTWEKAIAITGLQAWGDSDALAVVQGWLDRAVATQTSAGNLCYANPFKAAEVGINYTPTGSLSSSLGMPLLALYERTSNKYYLDAAERQIEALVNSPRTSDGGIAPRYEALELWIDSTYLTCPFLVKFGKLTNQADYIEEGVHQLEVHVAHLLDDKTNLARHMWCEVPNTFPQSTFWARGCGWLYLAAIELLDLVPSHPKAQFFKDVAGRTLTAVSKYQDASGYFRNTLDDPTSKLEASGTLMFAYAIPRAVDLGLVDKALIDDAVRAFDVVAGSVEASGKIPGVSVPPGGPNVAFDWAMFGQGFFLLAAKALQPYMKGQSG
jgi:unsaturated rhamnogalacturonyl hydrolase